MPRDAVSRTANVERNGEHKWVNNYINKDLLTFKFKPRRSSDGQMQKYKNVPNSWLQHFAILLFKFQITLYEILLELVSNCQILICFQNNQD